MSFLCLTECFVNKLSRPACDNQSSFLRIEDMHLNRATSAYSFAMHCPLCCHHFALGPNGRPVHCDVKEMDIRPFKPFIDLSIQAADVSKYGTYMSNLLSLCSWLEAMQPAILILLPSAAALRFLTQSQET